jgi:YbgC/YbaW family acyl-CoA thioester hydrolase
MTIPFVHARRILWAETDPARIVYTPRFLDYAVEAVDAFLLDRLGAGFFLLNEEHGVGTPFVHAALDFRSPVSPRDVLETELRLTRLGGSSLTFRATGRAAGRLVYEGKLVCAFVRLAGPAMTPIRVPEEFRAKLQPDADFAASDPMTEGRSPKV